MASVKLTFLKYKGRAEYIRFLFAQSSIKYEDDRVEVREWVEKMKGDAFTRPVLEYSGTVVSGNMDITKFVTEKYGLTGANEEEKLASFGIVKTVEDIWDKMSSYFWERDEEKKETAKKELMGVYLPQNLKELEIISMKNQSNGWMVGNELTCADLALAVLLEALSEHKPEILPAFPNLNRIKKSVEELPNIKKWIAERPTSDL